MKKQLLRHFYILLLGSSLLTTGCNAMLSKQPLQTTYYSLDGNQFESIEQYTQNSNLKLPTLIINPPKANAGFDSRRMMYTRAPHQIEYFAKNEWVDTPARMLQPLMVSAIEKIGYFKAVLPKDSLVKSNIRLETEIVQLIQMFDSKPSRVQFTLRAALIDNVNNKIIAHREFEEVTKANSDDPIGGVNAANQAVNILLERLRKFSQEAAIAWQATNSSD